MGSCSGKSGGKLLSGYLPPEVGFCACQTCFLKPGAWAGACSASLSQSFGRPVSLIGFGINGEAPASKVPSSWFVCLTLLFAAGKTGLSALCGVGERSVLDRKFFPQPPQAVLQEREAQLCKSNRLRSHVVPPFLSLSVPRLHHGGPRSADLDSWCRGGLPLL